MNQITNNNFICGLRKYFRYDELVQVHGKLDPLVNIDLLSESPGGNNCIPNGDKYEQRDMLPDGV